MFQAEMDFDGLRGAKVPPPGGVPPSYIEDRAVPQATKQGAKAVRPYDGGITGLTYGNNLSLTQTYDNQYRVSSISVGSIFNLTYGYDANGNVTSVVDTISPPGGAPLETSATYTYQQGSNKLTHIEAQVSKDFGYDLNGNITSENNRTYIYDLLNRLVTVSDNGTQVASYTYNASNQRMKKTTSAGTTIFHYDPQGHLIAETNNTGQTLVEYVYLGDQLLAMIRPTEQVYYYHTDHLGTPRVLTNSSGAVAWKAAYGPFGAVNITVAGIENNLRFPGQYYDTETGLHYNGNRYYDPKTGRYITPDPIGLEGGINLYPYVDGNPVNKKDLEGMTTAADADSWVREIPKFWPIAAPFVAPAVAAGAYIAAGIAIVALTSSTIAKDEDIAKDRCGRGERRCRGTIRYAPPHIMAQCPPRVYGIGKTMHDCQNNAKFTAPQQCRQYYGHFSWLP